MEPNVWERRDDEREIDFAAFRAYRDGPRPRSIDHAARVVRVGQERATDMAQRFDWAGRVLAFDRHLDRVMVAQRIELIQEQTIEWVSRHFEIIRSATDILSKEFDKLADAARDCEGPVVTRQRDLIDLMERAVVLDQRLRATLRGEDFWPKVAPQTDFSRLSEEDLETLRRILAKVGCVVA